MLNNSYSDSELKDLLNPIVYLLTRAVKVEDKLVDIPLYVGYSSVGVVRPLGRDHLHKRIKSKTDSLAVIPCSTENIARQLENNLINILNPIWNKTIVNPYLNVQTVNKPFIKRAYRLKREGKEIK